MMASRYSLLLFLPDDPYSCERVIVGAAAWEAEAVDVPVLSWFVDVDSARMRGLLGDDWCETIRQSLSGRATWTPRQIVEDIERGLRPYQRFEWREPYGSTQSAEKLLADVVKNIRERSLQSLGDGA
jgi:hypothetical protein